MPDQYRYYGWIPSKPDIRDLMFAPHPFLLQTMPPATDLSQPLLPAPFEPTWNQGALGSCGPNSAGEDIVFAGLRDESLKQVPMPSRLFIYYTTRAMMGTINSDSGVDNRTMLKALNQYGWCDEEMWPYDVSRYQQKPSQQCFDQAATRRISQYLAVQQDLDTMKSCIASGFSFIYGFTVYQSFESPQVQQTGLVPIPTRSERVLGGHDILAVGYNDGPGVFNGIPPGYFKMKNHWGRWGYQGTGYCFMPYQYAVNPQLANDFWTIRGSGMPAPPKPNPPDPPPPPGPPNPNPNPPPTPNGNTRQIVITGSDFKVTIDGKPV